MLLRHAPIGAPITRTRRSKGRRCAPRDSPCGPSPTATTSFISRRVWGVGEAIVVRAADESVRSSLFCYLFD